MIFPIKDMESMLEEMMDQLKETTPITDFSPGSIARAILEIWNKKLGMAYEDFDFYSSMLFLSTSTGHYLDMIGELLNCKRLFDGETDQNYRYRISQQVFTAATANQTALRLKCLSVPDVKDVIMTPFSQGTGSFTIHVITDHIITPREIMDKVTKVVDENKAEGIRTIVTQPRIMPLDLTFSLTLRDKNASMNTLAQNMKIDLTKYLDSLRMGVNVPVQKLVSFISIHPDVDKVFLSSLKVDGSELIIQNNILLDWDERIYVRNLNINKL